MTSTTESHKRIDGHSPLGFAEWHYRDPEFPHEILDGSGIGPPAAPGEHKAGFGERWRTHPYVVGLEDPVDKIEIAGLSKEHGNQRRRVECHTPPGP